MERRNFILAALAGTALAATGAAMAAPHDRDRDHRDGRDHRDRGRWGDRGWRGDHDWRGGDWHGDHDRYWRPDYRDRRYIDRERIFINLRRRHYRNFLGDPMWYEGRYVVRTYDRFGRLIFVEVDPYTGDFIGVIGF